MPDLSERYTWEAEREDGTIIREGGDLSGCVRFSLVPGTDLNLPSLPLPRHDIIGVPLVRRFGRGFVRVVGPKAPEYLHCCVCRDFRLYVRASDGAALITPAEYELYI